MGNPQVEDELQQVDDAGLAMGFVRLLGLLSDPLRRAGKMKMEPVMGGVDVYDAEEVNSAQPKSFPEHLIVMVNGIIGSAGDWKYAAERFVDRFPDKVIVHRSECNYSTLTFDGVDLMGERLAKEVLSVVSHRPGVQKISFVAHSLGGLVARYAIGKLHEPLSSGESTDFAAGALTTDGNVERIAGLKPMNFITFATPHLGSRGRKQLPLLCGVPFLERSASQTAHLVAGRTGTHLFLTDEDDGKPPLLLQMVGDSQDLRFRSALSSFQRRVAYSNANYDYMVGWSTSSIRRPHELPKDDLFVRDERYPHIVCVDRGDAGGTHEGVAASDGDPRELDLEEEMLRGLTRVPWERVDVSFHGSTQRYVAHSTIQVKSYWINSDGADVILHMMDNFLV
ncbi:unnamed protein product [Spirodela intermedia]|uniref:DUF676 domain-containing protein n=1 Tax=Spirodela intermedia TaxID=51605 RepID=A0A7I8LFT7_SPIIN|nr:unnamed protein product [Spirodela intermedia]